MDNQEANQLQNQAIQFCELSNIQDTNIAITYLEMANFDMQNALDLYFDMNRQNNPPTVQSPPQQQIPIYQQQNNNIVQNQIKTSYTLDEVKSIVRQYKLYLTSQPQNSNGFVSVLEKIKGSVISFTPQFIRGSTEGEQFITKYEILAGFSQLEWGTSNFIEFMRESKVKDRPVLIITKLSQNSLQKLINRRQQLRLFSLIGIIPEDVRQHIPQATQYECIFARNDLFDKIEILAMMNFSNLEPSIIKQQEIQTMILLRVEDKIKKYSQDETQIQAIQIQNTSFPNSSQIRQINQPIFQQQQQQQQQQELIAQQVNNEMLQQINMNIAQQFQEQQRRELAQKSRNDEQRQLREKQQKEYDSAIELEKIRQDQLQQQKILDNKKKQESELKHQQLEVKRQKFANMLYTFEDSINIKFRMPNGDTLEHNFNKQDIVQELFDFIECQPDQYFDGEGRNFDLIQNFPFLTLINQKNQIVSKVFDTEMEQLIVKEL